MAAKSYSLFFEGYWRAINASGLPAKSGIYCVYAGTHNIQMDTVWLRKLIYIGEAANVRNRVITHDRWQDWERELESGEVLCFSSALIAPQSDRQRAEAAMIYQHKPPCNVEYVQSFPYEQTTITTSGRNALLSAFFTVYTTSKQGFGTLHFGGRANW